MVWLSVTQSPDLLRQWRRIGRALGDTDSRYVDLDEAEDRLGALLQDRECLIVMDDVWEARHAEPVWNALGPKCRLLLTTRDKGIGRTFGAGSCEADVLSPHAALSLLSQWAEVPLERLPKPARQLADECGCLPLALAICGAMVKATVPWEDIVDAVAKADLSFLGHELANYPYPHVMRALQASVDFLGRSNGDAPLRYHELAVFVPERRIPEAAVLRLWCRNGFSERSARKLLADFDTASLVRVTGEDSRFVELHDLQWDYVRSHVADAVALHRRFVTAYGDASAWPTVADDTYFFDKIATHLVRAQMREELLSLASPPWMQAQFARTLNHRAFASDLDLIIDHLSAERPLDLVALIRACLVHATLGAISTRVPPVALAVLATCDQVQKGGRFRGIDRRARAAIRGVHGYCRGGARKGRRRRNTDAADQRTAGGTARGESDQPDAAVALTLRAWSDMLGWTALREVPDIATDERSRRRLQPMVTRLLALESSSGVPPAKGLVWEAATAGLERGLVDEAFACRRRGGLRSASPSHGALSARRSRRCRRRCRPFRCATPFGTTRFVATCSTSLAADLAAAGRRDEALAAAHRFANESDRDAATYAVAHALEQGGWPVAADETVEGLSPSWRAAGLAMLARSRARAGAIDDARALALRSVEECSTIDDENRAALIAGHLADVFSGRVFARKRNSRSRWARLISTDPAIHSCARSSSKTSRRRWRGSDGRRMRRRWWTGS